MTFSPPIGLYVGGPEAKTRGAMMTEGCQPDWEDFRTGDLANFDEAKFDQCMAFDAEEWKAEIVFQRELLAARLS